METGLHYNRFRYYSPELGRYMSADPIGQAGGVNIHGYVRNNPQLWVDPLGLDVCTHKSGKGYRHEWVEIGGDADRSYGQWPGESPLWGDPAVIANPDYRASERDDEGTRTSCTASTSEEDNELEKWINEAYDVGTKQPGESNTNENYNALTNNCTDFTDAVNEKLREIQTRTPNPPPGSTD